MRAPSARGGVIFATLLALGGLIRVAALPLPGTGDMGVWKLWTYNGAVHPPGELYGTNPNPANWRILEFNGGTGNVVYPPFSLYELSAVGRIFKIFYPSFPDNTALTVAIKLLVVCSEVGFLFLIFLFVKRKLGVQAGRWAALAYWLNPAMILAGSMLGYLDALFVLPAAAAFLAATEGWLLTSGALIAVAAWTKPQGLVLVPAVILTAWAVGNWRVGLARISSATAGLVLGTVVSIAPVISAGGWPSMALSLSRLGHHDMLSGNACNVWWVIGYALRVQYAVHDLGWWGAVTMRPRILGIGRVIEMGYPNPRMVGTLLAVGAMTWALWTARKAARDWSIVAAVGAFLMHAYAMLAAQVHENHLYAAVPLLVIAAAARPRYRPVFWSLSAIFALNLNLFYGISEFQFRGRYMIPSSITVIDLTVLVAVANCLVFAWHGLVLRRECALVD